MTENSLVSQSFCLVLALSYFRRDGVLQAAISITIDKRVHFFQCLRIITPSQKIFNAHEVNSTVMV